MPRTLRRALRPARLHSPARRSSARTTQRPPTAREALGTDITARQAITPKHVRLATPTARTL